MATKIVMPKLGFDMEEGKLLSWLKEVGEEVSRGEPIAEVETEKADVEVEAFADGILAEVLVEVGETVPVGTLIGVIAGADETYDLEAMQAEALEAGGEVAEPAAEPPEPAPAEPERPVAEGERVKASPAARRMAEEEGVSLAGIEGSGPGGRVVLDDVKAAIDAAKRVAPAEAGEVPLSRMRRAIARRMAESKRTVPHFYATIEVEMAQALRIRDGLNATLADEEVEVSINDLVLKAVALALRSFPQLNASFEKDSLRVHEEVNLAQAVALEEGLINPVLHRVDEKPLPQIARDSRALVQRARAGNLRSEDLSGATFTVSNLGMFDVEEFAAIIVPPEAGILAVGTVRPRTVVHEGEVWVAETLKLTLSADHRAVDGAYGARFLQELKGILENPVRLLI